MGKRADVGYEKEVNGRANRLMEIMRGRQADIGCKKGASRQTNRLIINIGRERKQVGRQTG